ncbi:MAG TPA: LytR family transcriptional regulator, partial [Mycobacterium sp.]
MSDGDNATPGPPRLPGPPDPGDNQWLTRSPRPSPGAAPWERNGTSESEDVEKPSPGGNHTDGVTVADLIAKVHGDSSVPEELRRPRPEPEAPRSAPVPPPAPRTEVIPAVWQPVADAPENADTEVIPVVSMPSSDLPDLARRRRADRVPPSRIGTGKPTTGGKPRKRRMTMLACRAAAALIAVLALALTGGAWQWQSSKNNMLNKVSALDPNSHDILDPNAQFGDENFLIVGVDSRFGENSDMGAGDTQDAGGTRSDTVMLVNIPANRKRVV